VIVVDSSVWIANLRNTVSQPVRLLRSLFEREILLVGDIILLEVLQGAADEAHAARIARNLNAFDIVPMLSPHLAVQAAHNYRLLRARGITVRKTADMIIGTYCIEHGHALLHDDRDFEPMQTHLGLQVL
jgi:predicted nucleic acid-binding protein